MAYQKTNWVDNETPISAENLNKIEDGIVEASKTGGILTGSVIGWNSDTIPEGYEEVENNGGIETITNENGTAIKFPDGTMICKHKIIGASHPNQTLRDNSYFYAQGKYSSDSPENIKDWTFPEEFATTDDLVVSIIVSSSAYTMTSMGLLETTGTRGFCVTPYPVDSVLFIWNFIAIGRWK